MEQPAYVYIMASRRNGTLYTGSTPDLPRLAWEHRSLVMAGFTERYRCILLVWYEQHPTLDTARLRERQMKEWKRGWKLREIEGLNPGWEDLSERLAPGRRQYRRPQLCGCEPWRRPGPFGRWSRS